MEASTESQAQSAFELRLRHALLESELVSEDELADAIEQQLILGGQLATNLWELGLMESCTLNELAGKILNLPVVGVDDVLGAPKEVLQILSPTMVERTRVLPFRQSGSTLHVATCDPWDDAALRQVAVVAGKLISPHFLGEVDLMRLAAHIYGLPLSARFRLGRSLPSTIRSGDEEASEPAPAEDLMPESFFENLYDQRTATPAPLDRDEAEQRSHEFEEIVELEEVVEEPAPTVSPPRVRADHVEIEVDVELEFEEALHSPQRLIEPEPSEEPISYREIEEPTDLRPIAGLEEAGAALEEASDRDSVGLVLLRFALGRGRRVALLSRRGNVWFGWLGAGPGVDPSDIPGMMLPSEPGTAFGLVGQTGAPFLGPLSPHPVHEAFLSRLGKEQPLSAGFFPVHHRGKLAFGIYLDDGHERSIEPDVGELLVLAQRTAATLDRILAAKLAKA